MSMRYNSLMNNLCQANVFNSVKQNGSETVAAFMLANVSKNLRIWGNRRGNDSRSCDPNMPLSYVKYHIPFTKLHCYSSQEI